VNNDDVVIESDYVMYVSAISALNM